MLIISAFGVFVTWAIMAITLIGIGSAVLPLFLKNYALGDVFWMGLGVSVALLEIWSLVGRISFTTTISLFGIGALGLLLNRSILADRARNDWQANRRLIVPAVAMTLFLAFRACGPFDYYDTGLYGAQAVRWIMTYAAVPGVANVHGRLGFNSSAFLCVAALNHGVWKDLGHHLFGGFMISAMLITVLPACARLVRRSPLTPADWFRGILAIPVVSWATRSKIVGTLTDEPAAIVSLVGAGILFDTFCLTEELDGQTPHNGPTYERMIVATTLFALAIAFKISTIVFALLAWCLAFRCIWSTNRAGKKRRVLLTTALALSAMILLPWCTRGIILSGYPLYPAAALGVPTDWRVPTPVVKSYAAGVRSWGRNPDAVSVAETQGTGWAKGWARHAVRDRVSFQVPLAISVGGLGVGMAIRLRKKRSPVYRWLWLILPSLAGLGFWFWGSPDVRFAQFSIWTMAGTLGTWGVQSVVREPQGARAALAAAGLLALATWCLAGFGWREPYRRLLAEGGLTPLPKGNVTRRKTLSGLTVYVPAEGNQCWDAPLPCTPYFDQKLRLRDGKSMRWGFASEGKPEF